MELKSKHAVGISGSMDTIDWEQVMNDLRLTREEILEYANVSRQLVEGLFTDLVVIDTGVISGLFSLRAFPCSDGGLMMVRAYSLEKPKTLEDEIYVFGNRIESETIRRSLLEKTDWTGFDGKRRYGYANANAGSPVRLEVDGKRDIYLLSVHQQSNRVVGETLDTVRDYFFHADGNLRGRSIFGVFFTERQCSAMCEGRAVRIEGCMREDGKPFGCFVQFDASLHQVVVCHPTWVKEALKAGVEL